MRSRSAAGREWEQGDVALAVIASLVLLIAIAAGGILGPSVRADAGLAGRLMALMGAASLAVAGYHVITRPGADFPGAGDYVALRPGIWAAVLGSALIIAGGLIAASAQQGDARQARGAGTPASGFPADVPSDAWGRDPSRTPGLEHAHGAARPTGRRDVPDGPSTPPHPRPPPAPPSFTPSA